MREKQKVPIFIDVIYIYDISAYKRYGHTTADCRPMPLSGYLHQVTSKQVEQPGTLTMDRPNDASVDAKLRYTLW